VPIRYEAFEPKENETTGISVFRVACLTTPDQALHAVAERSRGGYAIALLPVADVLGLGLTVRPDPITSVPGHAVIPELNIVEYRSDKNRLRMVMKRLAEIASRGIVHTPSDAGG